MLVGFYSGVSGLLYNEEKLAVTSSNLSNVDTSGFRRSLLVLRSRDENSASKWVDSDVRRRVPKFYGIRRAGVYKIYEDTGTLKDTGNPHDIAIPPELKNAFFSVSRTDPLDDQTYYTRNGSISIGPEDTSVPGSPTVLYLGGHIALDESGNPLEVSPNGGELEIGRGGIVRQGGEVLGELPIFRLNKSPDPNIQQSANLQQLLQLGDSLYKVPNGFEREFNPSRIMIGENGVSQLMLQGLVEGSNVNPIDELLHMTEATKSYSSNMSSISSQMDGLEKLFQMVRS